MKKLAHKAYSFAFVRFNMVGVANLALSYAAYLAAWYMIHDYKIAFWISIGVSLAFMSIANIRHTFARQLTVLSVVFYAGYYAAYSLINLAAITYLIERLGVMEEFAPFITLVGFMPLHYLLSGMLIRKLTPTDSQD